MSRFLSPFHGAGVFHKQTRLSFMFMFRLQVRFSIPSSACACLCPRAAVIMPRPVETGSAHSRSMAPSDASGHKVCNPCTSSLGHQWPQSKQYRQLPNEPSSIILPDDEFSRCFDISSCSYPPFHRLVQVLRQVPLAMPSRDNVPSRDLLMCACAMQHVEYVAIDTLTRKSKVNQSTV
jgi:hypothetical protein